MITSNTLQRPEMILRSVLSAIPLLIAIHGVAQQQVILPERHFYREIQRAVQRDSSSALHMGMRPGLLRRVNKEKVFGYRKDSSKYYYWVTSRLLRDHFVEVREGEFRFTIDPLVDLQLGWDFLDSTGYTDSTRLYTNSRGLLVQADIGSKLSFQTGFIETQAFLPAYLREWVDDRGIVPGMGRAKIFKGPGFDYAQSFGTVSYSPRDNLNFQMGYGRQFVGFGYRSLLLSDAAFNYPFLKGQVQWWDGRMEYTSFVAVMQNLTRLPTGEVPESLFRRKLAGIHYLSMKVTPRWEVGLFEATIWERWTEQGGVQPMPWQLGVPVFGIGTATEGFSGVNNVLVGLNTRAMVGRHLEIYGQLAADDPESERIGTQLGVSAYDVGLLNLDVQVEWNSTSSFLYAHPTILQSYSNHNQPLGHPAGGGVDEWLGILNYRYRRWMLQVKGNYLLQTTGPEGQWDADPDAAPTSDVPFERELKQVESTLSFFLNPKTNARLSVGYLYREETFAEDVARRTGFLTCALRMAVMNRYADF